MCSLRVCSSLGLLSKLISRTGTGSYKRMKAGMAEHVSAQQVAMFDNATKQVKSSLADLCANIRTIMLDRADKVYVSMQKDYMTIIGGVNADQTVIMPRQERAMRRDVDEAVTRGDKYFGEVLEAALDELKEELEAEEDASKPESENVDADVLGDDVDDDDDDDAQDEQGESENESQSGMEEEPEKEEGESSTYEPE